MSADRLVTYLTATRTGRQGVLGPASITHYTPLIELCRSIIKPPSWEHPKVGLVYSLSRRSELLNLGESPILIHDQHLGQTLATCLRILATGPDLKAKTRFFSRILAEESLSIGDAAGAATGYLMAAKFNEDWALVPKSIAKPEIIIEAWITELFILAHEYCHLLMFCSPGFAASRRRVGTLLIENKMEEKDPILPYTDMEKRYPGRCKFENFVEMMEQQQKFFRDNINDLIVETSCDDFALHVLLHLSKDMDIPIRHVFRAAFLALRHTRMIYYIRECVSSVKARPDVGGTKAVRILQAREQALRGVMALAAKASGFTAQLSEALDELSDVSDQQDREIDMPLLFDIIPAFAKARNKTARNRRWSYDDTLTIASLQKWDTSSDVIEHLIL